MLVGSEDVVKNGIGVLDKGGSWTSGQRGKKMKIKKSRTKLDPHQIIILRTPSSKKTRSLGSSQENSTRERRKLKETPTHQPKADMSKGERERDRERDRESERERGREGTGSQRQAKNPPVAGYSNDTPDI